MKWQSFKETQRMKREFPSPFNETPVVPQDEFHDVQQYLTDADWRGDGRDYELPGGGNADNDGDTDAIEQRKPATRVVVGPKSFVEDSNK